MEIKMSRHRYGLLFIRRRILPSQSLIAKSAAITMTINTVAVINLFYSNTSQKVH